MRPDDVGARRAAFFAAIQQHVPSVRSPALAGGYAELRRVYASGRRTPLVPSPAVVAAYAVARLPATMAANEFVLAQIRDGLVGWAPTSMLDVGCGLGPSALVASTTWPSITRLCSVDDSPRMLGLAETVADDPTLGMPADRSSLAARDVDDAVGADLVVLSYSLGELPDPSSAVLDWWRRTVGTLVVIEPGTPAGFDRIRQARSLLIESGGAVIAPCPHDAPCPIPPGDWCHFTAALERSPSHRAAKGAALWVEHEPFSYVAVTRAGHPPRPAGRVLRHPQQRRGHVRLQVCADTGELASRVVAKSSRDYRTARALVWGDPIVTSLIRKASMPTISRPDRCVATIIDVNWPTCTARDAITGDYIEAVAGHALQELAIVLRPGDHVVIEDGHPYPIVTFRFWRATVTEAHDRRVVIDPPSSGGQRNPTMRLPRTFALTPTVGQIVLCTREIVADIEAEGAPSSPDRLLTAYDHIRDAVVGPKACLRIPAEELPIDEALIRTLVADQFPQWADLSIRQVPSWENAMFRLGDDLAVRATRGRWALGQIEKELRWLPTIAAAVPLPITVPIAYGRPGHGYPWAWSICTWVDGEDATPDRLTDQARAGQDLARFLAALQAVDATGGPVAGQPPHWYGWRPLQDAVPTIRQTIEAYAGDEQQILNGVLEAALAAPAWDGPPVWLHGDLHPSNVVARDGRLAGVIDFGVLSTGDPAYDYIGAFALLDHEGRQSFRQTLDVDDPTWARARGWAISRCADQVIADHHRDQDSSR